MLGGGRIFHSSRPEIQAISFSGITQRMRNCNILRRMDSTARERDDMVEMPVARIASKPTDVTHPTIPGPNFVPPDGQGPKGALFRRPSSQLFVTLRSSFPVRVSVEPRLVLLLNSLWVGFRPGACPCAGFLPVLRGVVPRSLSFCFGIGVTPCLYGGLDPLPVCNIVKPVVLAFPRQRLWRIRLHNGMIPSL